MRTARPDLTELAAAKFVESHGAEALRILVDRAELALELGHKVAARTWRSMAEAAARLLGATAGAPIWEFRVNDPDDAAEPRRPHH